MNRIAAPLLMLALVTGSAFVAGHDDEPGPVGPDDLTERYMPRAPGVQRDMTFFFGPFTIPPGQDNNRVTVDIPVQGGFLTDVQANVYDAQSGARPSNQDMHIHHAHWFRTSEDPSDEYYASGAGLVGIAWVFGTGEERTRGGLDERSRADPAGISYGIYIEPGQPQALIYMLHNKNPTAANVYVALDVSFVYGSAEQIADAPPGCGPLPLEGDEQCRAGDRFHALHGKLWGNTFDVHRNFGATESKYIRGPYGADAPDAADQYSTSTFMVFEASTDALAIGTAGHLHPNGIDVIVANLGPESSPCGDADGDGYPGITLARSHKFEQVPGAFPHSEEYQMGATQANWRAPIRAGDRIAQFGVYENHDYASYEAMSFAGIYTDRLQAPAPRGESGCTLENTAAYLIGEPLAPYDDVTDTTLNDDWVGRESHGHCGLLEDDLWTPEDETVPCDVGRPVPVGRPAPGNTVHIANFLNVPGDMSLSGDLGAPAQVVKGESLRFVNEDVAIGVRHTVTSCELPCDGRYVANYPLPDGHFDSDKMGNLDYIDGGVVGPSASPVWDLDTTEMEAGLYSYYCRIHPWMRGWVEVMDA